MYTQWKNNINEIDQTQSFKNKISEETQKCINELAKFQNELNLKKKIETQLDQKKKVLNKKTFK